MQLGPLTAIGGRNAGHSCIGIERMSPTLFRAMSLLWRSGDNWRVFRYVRFYYTDNDTILGEAARKSINNTNNSTKKKKKITSADRKR